jgi:FixJ family two-component response regulator
MSNGFRVFIVDDEPTVVKSLELLLRANGYRSSGFTSAEAIVAVASPEDPSCLLLDLRLATQSGLEVQADLRRRGFTMPIVFLSARADVPSTARAMREGALDFLVKPVDEPALLDVLKRAEGVARARQEDQQRRRATALRLSRVTPRERQVCDLIAQGLLNKQIAAELQSSENTIKVHRARVMRKLEVDSVAALVRLVGGQPD